jgi:hypothetical protein
LVLLWLCFRSCVTWFRNCSTKLSSGNAGSGSGNAGRGTVDAATGGNNLVHNQESHHHHHHPPNLGGGGATPSYDNLLAKAWSIASQFATSPLRGTPHDRKQQRKSAAVYKPATIIERKPKIQNKTGKRVHKLFDVVWAPLRQRAAQTTSTNFCTRLPAFVLRFRFPLNDLLPRHSRRRGEIRQCRAKPKRSPRNGQIGYSTGFFRYGFRWFSLGVG